MQNFKLLHQKVFELLCDNQNKCYKKVPDDVINDVIGLKNNRVLELRDSNPHAKFQLPTSKISRVIARQPKNIHTYIHTYIDI